MLNKKIGKTVSVGIFAVFIFITFLIIFSFISFADDSAKVFVNDKNAEIKVVWSKPITNPYAILKGPNLGADGISNINCDSGGNFVCSMDMNDSRTYYYQAISQLIDGNYSFSIYANDIYGNTMNDFVGRDFVIDTTPPILDDFSYYVSGNSIMGKTVDIYVDVANSELLNSSPELIIDNVSLEEVPAEFIGNMYEYYYDAPISDSYKTVYIDIVDRAGNELNTSKDMKLTAPRPPLTNPSDGAVISPYTSYFTFFFYEQVPRSRMKILYDGIEISNTGNFINSTAQYMNQMLYYYYLPSTIEGIDHTLTIQAWDANNNMLGPYDIHFRVNPDAPKMPNVYFGNVLSNSDLNGVIYSSTDPPLIRVDFFETGINLTDFQLISPNYSHVDINTTLIMKTTDTSDHFSYQTTSQLPEGLNSVMLSACNQKNGLSNCIQNVTFSVVVNSRPPYITWINPNGYDNAWASSVNMEIETDKYAECKYADWQVTGVTPQYFFEDSPGHNNEQFSYFGTSDSYDDGNGYIHDTKLDVGTSSDSGLPYTFNYSVVCRDYFGQYTPINYSTFSLDLNPPIIESITPSSSITYYFVLNVTTNKNTTCKYIMINSSSDVVSFDSPDYRNFYNFVMIPMSDDVLRDSPRLVHSRVFDHTPARGRLLNDGTYLIYVDCEDAAGNLAQNRQFHIEIGDLITQLKQQIVSVVTNTPLQLYNISLNGTINNPSSLLSFYTNRNSHCYFQSGKMQNLQSFDAQVNDSRINSMPVGHTFGFYHWVYLAGQDVLNNNYYLPQYPNANFPDGKYSYVVYCTTQDSVDSLFNLRYKKLVPLNGSDPSGSTNYYTYTQNQSFTIDTIPPSGLVISFVYPDPANPGYTYYTDRLTFNIDTTNESSDAAYFYVTVLPTSEVMSDLTSSNWTMVNTRTYTMTGLNMTDGGQYSVYAYAVDYAGNVQLTPDESSSITVNTLLMPTCNDSKLNNEETDIDCGGPNCDACGLEKNCTENGDCQSNYCALSNDTNTKVCLPAIDTCSDGKQDSSESDIDCGGSCVQKCSTGQKCISGSDCGTLLMCSDTNTCVNSCGDGNCELEYGETPDSCPQDCNVTQNQTVTPEQQCSDNGEFWYDGSCHLNKKPAVESESSGLGLFAWLLIIFCSLILVCGGGFMYYTYYIRSKKKDVQKRDEESISLQKQQISSQVTQRQMQPQELPSEKKPYVKKRDMSIMNSFDLENKTEVKTQNTKEDLKKIEKKIQKEDETQKPKEKSNDESDKKQKKKDDLDELLEKQDEIDKLSAIGTKKETQDFDELDKIGSGKNSEDLDELSSSDDDFNKLSDLVGDKKASTISDIAESEMQIKKAKLFDTLSSIKTNSKKQNKDIFQQVLIYLVKSGKVDKKEINTILNDLIKKDIIDEKDMSGVMFNIEKELR